MNGQINGGLIVTIVIVLMAFLLVLHVTGVLRLSEI